ncbi:MAG TPA: zinc ribbon domain-containing protein [Ktedonobacterales bacterium]|nr:zinc ribbon domain-containing protein [Ktedonobacterales bacterium]
MSPCDCSQRAEAARSNKHPANQLLQAGFAFCGHCGKKMHVFSSKRGNHQYRCASRSGQVRTYCPGNGPIVAVRLPDEDIWRKVVVLLNTDAVALALLERQGGHGWRWGGVRGLAGTTNTNSC